MSAVPLAEVKIHLNMLTAVNDVELQRFINSAEVISHRTGPLVPTAVTERHDGGGSVLTLKSPPAISLTSVGYADGSTVNVANLDLDAKSGRVHWGFGTAGWFQGGVRHITVTYQAGFTTLPEDLALAVKEMVRHLWDTQRANRASGRTGQLDEPVPGAFSSWPIRVRELVEPYTPDPWGQP